MFEQVVNRMKPPGSRIELLPRDHEGGSTKALYLHVCCKPSPEREQAEETFAFRANGLLEIINSGEMIATYRWKIFWLNSKICASEGRVPPECYFLLARQKNEKYLLLIPLIDGDTLFSLEGSECGSASQLLLHSFNNKKGDKGAASKRALLVSEGLDLFDLVAYSIAAVKQLAIEQLALYGYKATTHHSDMTQQQPRRGPDFINYLAWSTWDAFYTGVSSDKLMEGLRSFAAAGVTPRTVIVDDGWQASTCVDLPNTMQWAGRLESFEANYKFSAGGSVSIETETLNADLEISGWSDDQRKETDHRSSLAHLVAHMKESCGVKYVLLWHALTGYWAGVHGEAFKKYDASMSYASLSRSARRMSPALNSEVFQSLGVGLVSAHHVGSFFEDYHRAMKTMGVDGVKVDAQAIVSSLLPSDSSMSSVELSFRFQIALKQSVEQCFCRSSRPASYPLVHCMGHSFPNLLAILGLYGEGPGAPEVVVRASDDYWPGDDRSHGPHLCSNLLNSLLLCGLGVVDWDMFQSHCSVSGEGRTSIKAPLLHACARAVSGGPVTLSDRPLEHDAQLLARLALPGGRLPRCSGAAMPVERWLFADPVRTAGTPLLMQNTNGQHGKVVAAFHVLGAELANDTDNFQFLEAPEIDWKDERIQSYACSAQRLRGNKGGNAALLEDSELCTDEAFRRAMEIRLDISESDLRPGHGAGGCIAHRMSDGALMDSSRVHVHLRTIFDCDIVTFARKHWLGGVYVAVLGDLSMLNPGGCVLSVVGAAGESSSDGSAAILTVEVLSGAAISIVTSAAEARVVSCGDGSAEEGTEQRTEHADPLWQGCLRRTHRVVGGGEELLLAPPAGGAESVVVSLAFTGQISDQRGDW